MSKRPPTHPNPPAPPANAGEELIIFNPVSKWQEYVEVPGLTLFDIHREPRRENEDPDARVRIQLKVLGPEFHCPVCLGYIRNTRIVKECLHRFCYDCIEKCLRVGKKQCPQCRIHIPSRRSFRPDTNFDELIKSIYGDIEELEKLEELEIEKLNKKNMNNAYAESRKRGMLHQAEQRKRKASIPGLLGETVTPPARGIAGLKEYPLIEIILRRHPQEIAVDRLRKEYIRTSKEMTMETLKIFLGKKLGYSPYQHFQILAIADEDAVVLPNDITLAVVHREICDNPMNREMILYYRILPEVFDYTG